MPNPARIIELALFRDIAALKRAIRAAEAELDRKAGIPPGRFKSGRRLYRRPRLDVGEVEGG